MVWSKVLVVTAVWVHKFAEITANHWLITPILTHLTGKKAPERRNKQTCENPLARKHVFGGPKNPGTTAYWNFCNSSNNLKARTRWCLKIVDWPATFCLLSTDGEKKCVQMATNEMQWTAKLEASWCFWIYSVLWGRRIERVIVGFLFSKQPQAPYPNQTLLLGYFLLSSHITFDENFLFDANGGNRSFPLFLFKGSHPLREKWQRRPNWKAWKKICGRKDQRTKRAIRRWRQHREIWFIQYNKLCIIFSLGRGKKSMAF